MTENKELFTVKQLKAFLNQFEDDKKVLIQMIDGEYDRVGFIDEVSINHNDFTKKYYIPKDLHDAVLLVCCNSAVSSQY